MKSGIPVAILIAFSLLTVASSTEPERQTMTAGEFQQIWIASDAASKAACRFYVLGVAQGVSLGMSIADGKEKRPRIPANIPSTTLELVVKMTLGGDLTAFPADRELDASGGASGAPL